jgi:trehalose 6-phosphate phosphatase
MGDTTTLVAHLAEQPQTAGLLLDVDGTLAPIVDRPDEAAVPADTRAVLNELAARYALVACVSGRTENDARRVVGVDELVYIGEHGMGLDRRAEQWSEELDSLVEESGWEPERKDYSAAFHFRTADDQQAAVASLRKVERRAVELGLRARWGRKVLEVLPPVDANKGTAVRTLLAGRGLRRALYAGDDATDLEAFRGMDGLELAVRVAVVSDEGPNQLGREADVIVGGTRELVELLRTL